MFREKYLKNFNNVYVLALSFFLGLLIPLGIIFGATSDFTVSTLIGSDVTSPSIPTGLTATPVAISQIDLVWASSTDDFLLSGYHVWRDDVHIATTTIASYSDTGLTANTSYTYYVTAFDSSFNFSASSTPVSTTTLSIPPSTPTTTASDGSTSGTRIPPPFEQIISLEILPGKDLVTVRYTTAGHVRSIIKWGRSSSYELGSLAEQTFSKSHETMIAGLIPSTKYYFTIEGENKIGRYGVMHTGTFVTLPPEDVFPPGNVTNLTAVKEGEDIVLSWVNPKDTDLAKIRVVRNDVFYPSDIADGWVVYEGLGNGVRDTGAVVEGKWQYYTVFSYDVLGNISSGAVVKISSGTGSASSEVIIDSAMNEISLSLKDIVFIQDGDIIKAENEKVRIDGAKHLTISIPYSVVPEHLKTILVVIGDSRNADYTFQFLLRINKEKTAYMSTLAPFGISGNFPVQVSIFDFKTSQIGYTQGALVSHIIPEYTESEASGSFGGVTRFLSSIGGSYLVIFVLLLVALACMSRRLIRAKW